MPAAMRLGDKAMCPVDAHGCVACPHSVQGPAIAGSSDTLINNMPAIRKGDPGIHAVCCGGNTWTAQMGSATVKINGQDAMRVGDPTKHCGGMGNVIEGSSDVIIGG